MATQEFFFALEFSSQGVSASLLDDLASTRREDRDTRLVALLSKPPNLSYGQQRNWGGKTQIDNAREIGNDVLRDLQRCLYDLRAKALADLLPILVTFAVEEARNRALEGRLIFDDLDSFVGFASLAVAQTIILSNETSAIQPFVTGTIYSDFGDDQVVTFADDANPGGVPTVTENLGTFGELSAGFNYRSIYETEDGGLRELAASLRGDLTVSDRVLGGRLTGQLRLQW